MTTLAPPTDPALLARLHERLEVRATEDATLFTDAAGNSYSTDETVASNSAIPVAVLPDASRTT